MGSWPDTARASHTSLPMPCPAGSSAGSAVVSAGRLAGIACKHAAAQPNCPQTVRPRASLPATASGMSMPAPAAAHLFERAYVAAGLHLALGKDVQPRALSQQAPDRHHHRLVDAAAALHRQRLAVAEELPAGVGIGRERRRAMRRVGTPTTGAAALRGVCAMRRRGSGCVPHPTRHPTRPRRPPEPLPPLPGPALPSPTPEQLALEAHVACAQRPAHLVVAVVHPEHPPRQQRARQARVVKSAGGEKVRGRGPLCALPACASTGCAVRRRRKALCPTRPPPPARCRPATSCGCSR